MSFPVIIKSINGPGLGRRRFRKVLLEVIVRSRLTSNESEENAVEDRRGVV